MHREPNSSAGKPILYLNGKFYAGATNGVHRVADRLLRELDALARRGNAPSRWDLRLLVPSGNNWAPTFELIRKVPQRGGHRQSWEQLILPFVARDGFLASFANVAPSLHRAKLTMVHDAQFRLSPDSYSAKLRWGYRALIPLGARTSRKVLTVSDYARDSLTTFSIAKRHQISVVYNGADHILETDSDYCALRTHGLRRGKFVLLFGSTALYKNLKVVFDAWRAPALENLPLAIVGTPADAFVHAGLKPPASAIFLGSVGDAALRALYENAHCLLYPSRTEGFGLPPVEAMFCGCPVVAAPAGAIPEVCRNAVAYAGLDAPQEWVMATLALHETSVRASQIAAGYAQAAPFTWAAAGAKVSHALQALIEPDD